MQRSKPGKQASTLYIPSFAFVRLVFSFLTKWFSSANEIDTGVDEKEPHPCQAYFDECATLRCPYGIEAYVDDNQCNRCQCHDPCKSISCDEGSQCAIDLNRNRTTAQDPTFIAVCRQSKYPLIPGNIITTKMTVTLQPKRKASVQRLRLLKTTATKSASTMPSAPWT